LLFILNLIGLGGGPLYVGYISDRATAQGVEQSLVVGYVALFPVILLTIGAHLLAARSMRGGFGELSSMSREAA
jgi:hypothetical protein